MRTCTVEGCSNPPKTRGWCVKHYARWLRHGNAEHPVKKLYNTPEERFAAYTEWQGDCLIWTGSIFSNNYGLIKIDGKNRLAHRYAWERVNGKIPEGLQVDHKDHCTTLCCNVKHLRLATNQQNSWNKGKTNSTTGELNISLNSAGNFVVSVYKGGVAHHYGTFENIEDAKTVRDKARKELFGEFAGKG